MKCKILFFFFALVFRVTAQEPVLYYSFDDEKIDFPRIEKDLSGSEYTHVGFTPTYSRGLKGLALDLTSDVAVRIPVAVDSLKTPSYDRSFSVSLWVRTKPQERQGTPIMGNKKNNDKTSAGWLIGTNAEGAWYFNISDGKTVYDYEPTSQRQSINDGNWHQIAFSLDYEKQEIWFYLDGRNVAVYNVEGLKTAVSPLKTVIGGSDEYSDWGSRREWTAFNGLIDEVAIYDRAVSKENIKNIYNRFIEKKSDNYSEEIPPSKLKVQVWNIWHGGHRFGENVGVERVVDVLKKENADVIGIIETYGSGAIIADSLGYYFYLISSNLSIMSRYPIDNTIKIFQNFNSGGAVLDLGQNRKIAFVDVWLHWLPDMCDLFRKETVLADFLNEDRKTRQTELNAILSDIKPYANNADNIPVFVVGDFNCGSHLDWNKETSAIHDGLVIDWQTSRLMLDAGFQDSFRVMNPDPLADPGFTWSPLINNATVNQNCIRDRIDFIYYKGQGVLPYYSKTIDHHPVFWPSDHGSLVSYFYLNP